MPLHPNKWRFQCVPTMRDIRLEEGSVRERDRISATELRLAAQNIA